MPPWMEGRGTGWVTAEYGMLPRSTHTRTSRERGKVKGRTQEIQRLIGRSLRSVTDLDLLGPRMVTLDCDVLQADGGTRTAAITGACIALHRALARLAAAGEVERHPTRDLDYRQDFAAQVDMNVVGTGDGRLIEVQGTAEGHPFRRDELDELLDLATAGIRQLVAAQRQALEAEL